MMPSLQCVEILGALIPVTEFAVVSLVLNLKLIIDASSTGLGEEGTVSAAERSHHFNAKMNPDINAFEFANIDTQSVSVCRVT